MSNTLLYQAGIRSVVEQHFPQEINDQSIDATCHKCGLDCIAMYETFFQAALIAELNARVLIVLCPNCFTEYASGEEKLIELKIITPSMQKQINQAIAESN